MKGNYKYTDHYRYGSLIAKLLADRIEQEEAEVLDVWLFEQPENMQLFDNLINPWKTRWAQQWFKDNRISTRGIKWKHLEGWLKPDRKNLIDFYIVMAVMFLFLVLVYYVLKL